MRWIGVFNIAYGAVGLLAAVYIGRLDAIALCLWVMATGMFIRSRAFSRWMTALRGLLPARMPTRRR